MAASNSSKSILLIAAIDFGTTYSGYGFSFQNQPDEIFMNKSWGAEVSAQSYKTPTSLLVDNNGAFKAFGYEAERQYGITQTHSDEEDNDDQQVVEGADQENQDNPEIVDNENQEQEVVENDDAEQQDAEEINIADLHLFKQFKMELHGKEKLDTNVKLKATDGFELPAVDVFALSIKFLKYHLIKAVEATIFNKIKAEDVKWVLTVPAIWTEVAKTFMKEAAQKAGLVETTASPNLLIALEPEAASLFCRTTDMENFVGENEGRTNKLDTGDRYMVLDAGDAV